MHAPNFWGIKPLYRHFWKFCSLELMKDINRNSFMPLSTDFNAFRSPKKSVCKFDDFDCPQLYTSSLAVIGNLLKGGRLQEFFVGRGRIQKRWRGVLESVSSDACPKSTTVANAIVETTGGRHWIPPSSNFAIVKVVRTAQSCVPPSPFPSITQSIVIALRFPCHSS